MFLQSMRDMTVMRRVDGYFARASMPVRMAPNLVEAAFVRPLCASLEAAGLGRVTGFDFETGDDGEPTTLLIELSMATDAPRALEHVADVLERLDAPAGSTIGNAECPNLFSFGRSYGLGLYISSTDTDEDGRMDLVEACTDALNGSGLYQGSASIGDRTALYFYGDSFNRMRAAVTYVMTTDPRCRNAYARRLN